MDKLTTRALQAQVEAAVSYESDDGVEPGLIYSLER